MRKIVANNSLYDVYFGAGQSAGQYEAQKQEVGDVWSDIDYSKQLTAQKGARRERTLDTILAATEMVSTVGQGIEAKQQWEGELGSVQGKIGEGQRIGRSGKAWEDTGFIEKLFSGKEYKFGSGESARVMGKSDIAVAGSTLQYGGKVDFKRFKPPSAAAELVDNNQLSPKSATQIKPDNVGGKFYGERKGFDLGDIIGEKSIPSAIFGAGKERLSSIFSRKPEVGEGTVLEVDQKLEARQEELEAIPSPSKDYSKAQRKLDKLMDKKEAEGKLSFEEAENKENEDSILGMMGYYGK